MVGDESKGDATVADEDAGNDCACGGRTVRRGDTSAWVCHEHANTAKHNIKRGNGFLGDSQVEGQAIAQGLLEEFAPKKGPVLVLADWTDISNGKMLVFALPGNGRSIPFFVKVLSKRVGEGEMVQAKNEALAALKGICGARPRVIIVADRGLAISTG